MKRNYIVNGKVTYPTNEGSNTTFTFINKDTGELFNMQTTDDTEANSMTYGDTVVVEVTKVTIIPAPENNTESPSTENAGVTDEGSVAPEVNEESTGATTANTGIGTDGAGTTTDNTTETTPETTTPTADNTEPNA